MLPPFIPSLTAKNVHELPEGDDWLYEVKLDGYRVLVMKSGDRVQRRSATTCLGNLLPNEPRPRIRLTLIG